MSLAGEAEFQARETWMSLKLLSSISSALRQLQLRFQVKEYFLNLIVPVLPLNGINLAEDNVVMVMSQVIAACRRILVWL